MSDECLSRDAQTRHGAYLLNLNLIIIDRDKNTTCGLFSVSSMVSALLVHSDIEQG